jgi:hypothetical protein
MSWLRFSKFLVYLLVFVTTGVARVLVAAGWSNFPTVFFL